jgi:hypothetical protein
MREAGRMTEDQVRGTLDELRSLSPPPLDAAAAAQRRSRMTRAMRAAMDRGAAGPRLSWSRLLAWGALAAGAAAVVVMFTVGRSGRPPTAARGPGALASAPGATVAILDGALTIGSAGRTQRVTAGQQRALGAEDVLETSTHEGAQVRVGDVARVSLAPSSRVVGLTRAAGIAGNGVDRLTLAMGRAHLSIAKLGPGRTFRVVTDAATVQVHGTEFDVEIGAAPTHPTCVRVQDGLVEVIAGAAPALERTFLGVGQSWGCGGDAAAPVAPEHPTAPALSPSSPRNSGSRGAKASAAGDLRRQNQLFEEALRAERAGRHHQATEIYRRLLERYPGGPLARQAEKQLDALSPSE